MRIVLLLTLLLSFSAIGFEEGEAPESIWIEDKGVFKCSPENINLGESLNIHLDKGHYDELGLYRELDHKWLFLVVSGPPKEMKSLMTKEELFQAIDIEITNETTGFIWEKDGSNSKIFTGPGKYTFYNSDILESEVGGYKCIVNVK